MSKAFLSGSGSVAVTTEFQLLDGTGIFGAGSFFYDFYLKGEDAPADGIWQIWTGAAYEDMTGAAGGAGDGDAELLKQVEVPVAALGKVQIGRNGGTLSYWYAINGGVVGGAYPTYREVHGAASVDVEFYLEAGRVYNFVSDGTHSWEYAEKVGALIGTDADWTAFAEGTSNGFWADAPATRRVRLVPTGAVNFSVTSRKA